MKSKRPAAKGELPPEQLLTPLEVARWLNVSIEWVTANLRPLAHKLGRAPQTMRFEKATVQGWLESRRLAQQEEGAVLIRGSVS